MQIEHPQYFGKLLLTKGYRAWFKYMFYAVEGEKFIEEPLHNGLFDSFEDVISQRVIRANYNLPPRSAKTTNGAYLVAYSYAKNTKCNNIYTSFSQELLKEVSRRVMEVMTHPIFQAMYPLSPQEFQQQERPFDEYWREYLGLKDDYERNTFSSRKIVTASGGVTIFSSIGSAITGFGAGIRSAKDFSGMLVIDDANKPNDIHSKKTRDKVGTYFSEVLLSRVNNSYVPIVNIQQRLHTHDLTGILESKYKFETFKKPLVVDGICQLPKQYTKKRVEELKVDNYKWRAQYQQDPFSLGGNLISREYFKYYQELPRHIDKIYLFGDTAQKTKEANDPTVFQAWALWDGKIRLIDLIKGRWDADELLTNAQAFAEKHKTCQDAFLGGFYIEDKSSGTGLIQQLKNRGGVPVLPIPRHRDKLTRLMDVIPYIKSGLVELPFNEDYAFNPDFLKECEEFTADDSHDHDDQIDCMIDAITVLLTDRLVTKRAGLL